MQREALKDDEERRKRSEQMRKERAAVCFSFLVQSIAIASRNISEQINNSKNNLLSGFILIVGSKSTRIQKRQ